MKKIYQFFFNNSVTNSDFLAFFRISIGVVLLIHFLSISQDFDYLYGINKVIPTDIHTYQLLENVVLYDDIIHFLEKIGLSQKNSESFFSYGYCFLCITIIIGFYSRISALILLFLQIALIKSSYFYSYGVDYFSSMSLLYIALQPSDSVFSIKNTKAESVQLTPFRRLMQVHLCWAYALSGLEKLLGYNWRNGESVWKALHLPTFNVPFTSIINKLGVYDWLFVIGAWSVVLIELLYPIFIYCRKTRKAWLLFTVSMHLFIAFFLNLYFFSAIMIVWNITNFYFADKKVNKL